MAAKTYAGTMAHINSLASAVTAKLNSINVSGTNSGRAEQVRTANAWYTEQFGNLKEALSGYINGGTGWFRAEGQNKKTMENDIYELITAGVNKLCISLEPEEGEEPINFWDYFGAEDSLGTILGWTINDVYLGYTNLPTSHTLFSPVIQKLNNAPVQEHARREELQLKLMGDYMMYNQPELLEPDYQVLGPDEDPPTIQEIGTVIYVDWKLKEVIEAFNLDIYIPTYVRS